MILAATLLVLIALASGLVTNAGIAFLVMVGYFILLSLGKDITKP